MSREREAELCRSIAKAGDLLIMRNVLELLTLRFERYKEQLVDREDNVLRGQARELKELKKMFTP